MLGLVIDTELGNIVKANRFGYVKRAMPRDPDDGLREQRSAYERTVVDLAEKRWVFVNTLFGLSEAACTRSSSTSSIRRSSRP
jgi:5'-nucleotidase